MDYCQLAKINLDFNDFTTIINIDIGTKSGNFLALCDFITKSNNSRLNRIPMHRGTNVINITDFGIEAKIVDHDSDFL